MRQSYFCRKGRPTSVIHQQDNERSELKADVFKYIERCQEKFDFIFADPPYALERLSEIPDLIFKYGLLKEGGLFVLEHGKDLSFESHPYFIEHRYYGSVNFSFFGYPSDAEANDENNDITEEETTVS